MIENKWWKVKLLSYGLVILILFLNMPSISSFSKEVKLNNNILPSSFNWRNIDETDFSTPVKNQEFCKSDAVFALIASLETMIQYNLSYTFYCDLSEAHLFYNNNGNCDEGINISVCSDYLKNYGVPDEGCFPYSKKYCNIPSYSNISDWEKRGVQIKDWGWVNNDIESIKRVLITHGPLVVLINYSLSFLNYKGGIYKPKGKTMDTQWVSIFGYNDDPGYWICKNSWGNNWGEYGWFKIPYNSGMITNGKYLNSENIPNDCTGVLFLNGTVGNLKPDIAIIKIFQPSRGFLYTNHYQYTKKGLRSNLFTERLLYLLRNSLFNKIFKNRYIDIRTPWIINSFMIEVCAVKYVGNASIYIDDELKYNFTKTTFFKRVKFDNPGLHTVKAVAYNKDGDMSFDTRDFFVIS